MEQASSSRTSDHCWLMIRFKREVDHESDLKQPFLRLVVDERDHTSSTRLCELHVRSCDIRYVLLVVAQRVITRSVKCADARMSQDPDDRLVVQVPIRS